MRACGVDLKGNEAIFAVVDVQDDSSVNFVHTQIRKVGLGDDCDADELRNFQRTVQAFLLENKVFTVVIKDRPRKGAMSAGAPSFKMEAALQLIDGLSFHFYWGANVAKYLTKEKPNRPPNLLSYQTDAYFAALLHFRKAA